MTSKIINFEDVKAQKYDQDVLKDIYDKLNEGTPVLSEVSCPCDTKLNVTGLSIVSIGGYLYLPLCEWKNLITQNKSVGD